MKIFINKRVYLTATALIISACINTPTADYHSCQNDELDWSTSDSEPSWARVEPYYENGNYYYFTGSSGQHQIEREARVEAEYEARMAFVRSTGIKQSSFEEYLKFSDGLSSKVIDETISYRNTHKQFAEAFLRNSRVVALYVERYSRCQDQLITGSYYEVFAQIQVPKSERQAVQQWRAEQERKEQESRIRSVLLLASSVDEAHKLAESSQPLAALTILHAIRNDKNHMSRPERSGEVQRALLLHNELLAGLRLQLLSAAEQNLLAGGASAEPVRVRVWFSYQGQSLPAVGIPLTLYDSKSKFHGNQRSDEWGEAQFIWDFGIDALGEHKAYVSLDTAFMVEAADENELTDLRARRLQLSAKVR